MWMAETFVLSFPSIFSIWVLFHEHFWFTGQQGKRDSISLSPLYHFHSLHRHLDSRVITAESSPLHKASSRTRTGNLSLPSASHWPLSYAPLNPLPSKPAIIGPQDVPRTSLSNVLRTSPKHPMWTSPERLDWRLGDVSKWHPGDVLIYRPRDVPEK